MTNDERQRMIDANTAMMKTLLDMNNMLRLAIRGVELSSNTEIEVKQAADTAKWERVIKEGWFVKVSNDSQKEANTHNGVFFLMGHNPQKELRFKTTTSILNYKYCSTRQGPNVRQPHFGEGRPVDRKTIVTTWLRDGRCRNICAGNDPWLHTGGAEDIMSFMIHPEEGEA